MEKVEKNVGQHSTNGGSQGVEIGHFRAYSSEERSLSHLPGPPLNFNQN